MRKPSLIHTALPPGNRDDTAQEPPSKSTLCQEEPHTKEQTGKGGSGGNEQDTACAPNVTAIKGPRPSATAIRRTQQVTALAMHRNGHSTREIGRAVGVTNTTVWRWQGKAWQDEDIQRAATALRTTLADRATLVLGQAVDRISETLPEADVKGSATALRELNNMQRLERGQSTSNVAIEGQLQLVLNGTDPLT